MSIDDPNPNINEIARAYIEKLDRQRRSQSTGPFPFNRDTAERATHFSAGTWLPSTARGRIYCEECGQRMNGQSICSRCRASPTRLWLQFVSLGTLAVLAAYNSIFVLNFLPTHTPDESVARAWRLISEFAWLYGWIAVAVYLPVWAYYGRKKHGYRFESGVQVGIGLVVILLTGAVALPILPRMGWAWAQALQTTLASHPAAGMVVGWTVVTLALVSVCGNPESRDRFLGQGKGLALFAIALLSIILALSLFTAERCGSRLA